MSGYVTKQETDGVGIVDRQYEGIHIQYICVSTAEHKQRVIFSDLLAKKHGRSVLFAISVGSNPPSGLPSQPSSNNRVATRRHHKGRRLQCQLQVVSCVQKEKPLLFICTVTQRPPQSVHLQLQLSEPVTTPGPATVVNARSSM